MKKNKQHLRLKKLYKEHCIIGGMIDEIVMSCRLIEQKIDNERQQKMAQGYDLEPSDELVEEIMQKMPKFQQQLDKYQKRILSIEKEILCHY